MLQRLRKHDDLLASVATEIDELLSETPKPSVQNIVEPSTQNEPTKTSNLHSGSTAGEKFKHLVHPIREFTQKKKWSSGVITGLVITTLIFPIIGILGGIIGLFSGASGNQSVTLIILGIIMAIIYASLLL